MSFFDCIILVIMCWVAFVVLMVVLCDLLVCVVDVGVVEVDVLLSLDIILGLVVIVL